MARLGPSRTAILPTLLYLSCFPSRVCPTIAPSSSSCRYPSRIRRIHHSLVSRVTLYLFRAPSDRPSAVCTESTWSFRWDLTARGRRERGSTGTCTYMSRDRGKERESEGTSFSPLFAVDLHRSILHFRRFRLRESYRRYRRRDFHRPLLVPSRPITFLDILTDLSYLSSLCLTDRLYCFKKLEIANLRVQKHLSGFDISRNGW